MHQVYSITVYPGNTLVIIYTELYICFPTILSRGHFYIMVLYECESSAILSHPIKSRGYEEMVREFAKLADTLITRKFKTKLYMLENETYVALKHKMQTW